MELSSFSQLPISSEVLSALSDMGFSTPSPIQALAIPSVIEGIDVVGQAQTGTGKTVAFGIPMVEKVSSSIQWTQALVLCPTRELAIQIAEEFNRLLTYKKSINEKLSNLAEVSKLLHSRVSESRSHLMEMIIIVLIAIEVIPFVAGLLR